MDAHGYSLAKSTNPDTWKPMQITNVGGLQRCLAWHGAVVCCAGRSPSARRRSRGQVLRYFGTIFPGIAAGVTALPRPIADDDIAFVAMVMGGGSQEEWRDDIEGAGAGARPQHARGGRAGDRAGAGRGAGGGGR